MPHPIENHYVQTFASNMKMLLQQENSRLSGAVMTGSHVGEQASPVDQFGAISANIVTGRFNPMGNIEVPTDRRWVLPQDYDVPILLDSKDKLRLLMDPLGTYSQLALAAMNRRKDETILTGMFGNNQTGKNGGTSTAFASGQVVNVAHGAASATNMTVAKIKRGLRYLMANNVDLASEQVYLAINAANHESLLNEPEIINGDYNNVLVLVDGKVKQFLGVNFIHTELLTTGTDDAAGTSTQCPMWVKSGVYLGVWEDIVTDISVRKDLQSLPTQVYMKATFGATRLEEKKVVKIWAR